MAAELRKIKEKPLAAVAGFAAFAISTVLIAACHMTKDAAKKMRWHRIYSLFLTLAAGGHIALAHTGAGKLQKSAK